MSVITSPLLLGADVSSAYVIPRSLRFNSSDSAYLSRTPASAGNRKTWTWAGWVKRGTSTTNGCLFSADNGTIFTQLQLNSDDKLYFDLEATGQTRVFIGTSAVFRDYSAWYHIVFALDTTQAVAANRAKIYVNGIEQLTTNTCNQNIDHAVNMAVSHNVARRTSNTDLYFSGYLADIYFIDGQALTPTSFGAFDATTGVWNPIAYSGSYGTNGFHLPFSDNSAATATTLGKDTSGNGNNWTPNNLSVTAGSGNDSLVDSPTNGTASSGGDAGGTVVGNYATLNPLDTKTQTLANGNLDIASAASYGMTRATFGMSSGKWYWEITATSLTSNTRGLVGIAKSAATLNDYLGSDANGWGYFSSDGSTYNSGSATAYGSVYGTSDVIGISFDADSGVLKFYKNGTAQNSGTAAYTGLTSGPYFPAFSFITGTGGAASISANFGQRPFAYAAPSGFKSLNTANLPTPTILNGASYFDTKLYTGNGSTQTISGLAFSPDFVWVKTRSGVGYYHALYDSVRGTGTTKSLYSNATDAEGAQASYTNLTSFNSDGFSLGTTSLTNILNQNNETFAAWCWDAGSSTVTNTDGSITSTVRANASAGFSVVGWNYPSGTGASTIGHGLGVKPAFIIIKTRDNASNWIIYHISTGATKCFRFNTQGASTESDPFNNTEPTSSVFSIGAESWWGAGNIIAYCFAPVSGYSSFGSYTGNGSADGPFVYTGFRPRWVLFKCSSATTYWGIYDAARNTYNAVNLGLYPNDSIAELADQPFDFLSNGFKARGTTAFVNSNSATYVFAAFAENPFSIARAR